MKLAIIADTIAVNPETVIALFHKTVWEKETETKGVAVRCRDGTEYFVRANTISQEQLFENLVRGLNELSNVDRI